MTSKHFDAVGDMTGAGGEHGPCEGVEQERGAANSSDEEDTAPQGDMHVVADTSSPRSPKSPRMAQEQTCTMAPDPPVAPPPEILSPHMGVEADDIGEDKRRPKVQLITDTTETETSPPSRVLEKKPGALQLDAVALRSPLGRDGRDLQERVSSPKLKRPTGRTIKRGKKLGQGGFGEVYQALDQQSGEFLAVKRVKHSANVNVEESLAIKQLRNEIELMKKLSHMYIVGYMGMEEGTDYIDIFMEYVPGGSLLDVLNDFGGPFPEGLCARFLQQIIKGVIHLHEHNVVHRDIKAANILLHTDGRLRLADFGAAVQLANMTSRKLDKLGGTALWMPPEVLIGGCKAPIVACQDIWSIGCTLVEMKTAKPPFSWISDSDEEIVKHIANCEETVTYPESLKFSTLTKNFLNMCLQKDPAKRATAKELLETPLVKLSKDIDHGESPQSPSKRKRARQRKDGQGTPVKSRGSPGKRRNSESPKVEDAKSAAFRKILPNTEDAGQAKDLKTPETQFGSPTELGSAVAGVLSPEKEERRRRYHGSKSIREIKHKFGSDFGLGVEGTIVKSVEPESEADKGGLTPLVGWAVVLINDEPATPDLLAETLGGEDAENVCTLTVLEYTLGTDVEVYRSSKEWSKARVSDIDTKLKEVVVSGKAKGDQTFTKRIGFASVDMHLRHPKSKAAQPAEQSLDSALSVDQLKDLDESKNLIEQRGELASSTQSLPVAKEAAQPPASPISPTSVPHIASITRKGSETGNITPLMSPSSMRSPTSRSAELELEYQRITHFLEERAKRNQWSPRFTPLASQRPDMKLMALSDPVSPANPSPAAKMPTVFPPLPCDPFCAALITAGLIVVCTSKCQGGRPAVRPILSAAIHMDQHLSVSGCCTPKSQDSEAAAPVAAPSPTLVEIAPPLRRARANTVSAGQNLSVFALQNKRDSGTCPDISLTESSPTAGAQQEQSKRNEVQVKLTPPPRSKTKELSKEEQSPNSVVSPDSETLPVLCIPTGQLWNRRADSAPRESCPPSSSSHQSPSVMLCTDTVSIDIDDSLPPGMHNLPLLLAVLKTRVVLRDCEDKDRLCLLHKAINSACTPHREILPLLQAYNWSIERGFQKLLPPREAEELADRIQELLGLEEPVVTELVLREVRVTWAPAEEGGYMVADVAAREHARPQAVERSGVNKGMRLLSIEGVHIVSEDNLREALKTVARYPAAVCAFGNAVNTVPEREAVDDVALCQTPSKENTSPQQTFRRTMLRKAHATNIIIILLCAAVIVLVSLVVSLYLLLALLILPVALVL